MATTFHLALVEEWARAADGETYAPAAFDREGFIHCTDGADELIATANRHYRDHPGQFLVLELDLARVDAPVRYEDERGNYPHVYGRFPRSAIVAALEIRRSDDGAFLGFGGASRP